MQVDWLSDEWNGEYKVMNDYYDEGWYAYKCGIQREDNPYPFNVPAFSDWDMGWYEAEYYFLGKP